MIRVVTFGLLGRGGKDLCVQVFIEENDIRLDSDERG